MLAKKYRNLSKNQVQTIFKTGKSGRYENIFIKFIPNNLNHPRLTIIAPSKNFKKAVERNKIKRLLSNSAEKFIKEIKSYDIAILLNKNSEKEIALKKIEVNLKKVFINNNLINH